MVRSGQQQEKHAKTEQIYKFYLISDCEAAQSVFIRFSN